MSVLQHRRKLAKDISWRLPGVAVELFLGAICTPTSDSSHQTTKPSPIVNTHKSETFGLDESSSEFCVYKFIAHSICGHTFGYPGDPASGFYTNPVYIGVSPTWIINWPRLLNSTNLAGRSCENRRRSFLSYLLALCAKPYQLWVSYS